MVGEQEARLTDSAARLAGHEDAAAVALAQARLMAVRLRAGIDTVTTNPDAAEAFRFANHAMWLQRAHSLAANRRRDNQDLELAAALAAFVAPEHHSWRPFQLAFLLVNLSALAEPTHAERSGADGLVDLLFFPTGGGKTEAYLGLTGFTLAIRRLQGTVAGYDGRSGGVAAITKSARSPNRTRLSFASRGSTATARISPLPPSEMRYERWVPGPCKMIAPRCG